ncbi:odorant receptor Or1 [Andrena cerasifolii]|uniref:odorant receptor Or1 n=1 Tax=Andrena cerasifolii TaxID=2819439 RepID=UPI004037D72B
MDSDQYEYLRNNKRFLYSIALWPYQQPLEKILIGILVIPSLFLQISLEGGGLVAAVLFGNVDVFMENFSPFVISWMCLAKYMNFMYNHKQIGNLLTIMQTDWKIHKKIANEYDILCRHYGVAKKITFNYAVFLYGSMLPFMVVPSALNVADALGIYNLSDERPLMFRVDNYLDVDKYYYFLLIHSYFGTVMFITVVVAVDSMIVAFIQHECGLCEILGQRLKNIVENDSMDIELHPDKREDRPYQNVRNCVILHKHIIEFARIVEEANTTSYFFQLGLNMIGISFTQYQAVTNLDNPSTSLRFGGFTISLLSNLLLVSWPGQQLLDYTERISEYAASGSWYYTSVNARRLLSIIISESIKPLKLTALKIYTLNIENFSSVVRTSFSYCMVLCSVQ